MFWNLFQIKNKISSKKKRMKKTKVHLTSQIKKSAFKKKKQNKQYKNK